jgi:hypothetical protein
LHHSALPSLLPQRHATDQSHEDRLVRDGWRFFIATNVIILKMKSVAEEAGGKLSGFYLNPFEPPGPLAHHGQGKRFAALVVCMVLMTVCLIAGGPLR